ncbi:MAG: serine/threonine protein kinase, partial [Gammaproteobacteria bacterium]|nr:serine/threonine protein kinase [Gammaproteobacteria bacterium]
MTDKDSINIQGTVYEPRAPKATPTLAPGDIFHSRYEVIRELGQGGMGVAYLANDTLSKEEVVLKVIHPTLVDDKARERMISEGVMTRKIRNPKIVSVYDVNEADGQIFLAMEYVQGEPLRNWMQSNMVQNINAPLGQVVRIIQEILAGLTAAHETGVIHRDLKPENIMISGDPGGTDFTLRILDFGIATGIKTEVF